MLLTHFCPSSSQSTQAVSAPRACVCAAVSGWRSVLEVLIVAAADSAAAVVNQALDALQPVIAALYADVGLGHQHFLGIVTAVCAAAGWRSVLEVLIVAAADSAAAVVNQALDALQPVIAALYADVGVGHQHFLGIVTAVAATMRSPYHAELSVSAVHVMQSVAQRLSQSDPQVSYRAAGHCCCVTTMTGRRTQDHASFSTGVAADSCSSAYACMGAWCVQPHRVACIN